MHTASSDSISVIGYSIYCLLGGKYTAFEWVYVLIIVSYWKQPDSTVPTIVRPFSESKKGLLRIPAFGLPLTEKPIMVVISNGLV